MLTAHGLRRGWYETELGNAAYISGPKAKTAYDIDAGERIPLTLVTRRFLRPVRPGERTGPGEGGSW